MGPRVSALWARLCPLSACEIKCTQTSPMSSKCTFCVKLSTQTHEHLSQNAHAHALVRVCARALIVKPVIWQSKRKKLGGRERRCFIGHMPLCRLVLLTST